MVFVLNLTHAGCTKPIKTWDKQVLGKVILAHACSIINGLSKNKDEGKSQKNILFIAFTNLLQCYITLLVTFDLYQQKTKKYPKNL